MAFRMSTGGVFPSPPSLFLMNMNIPEINEDCARAKASEVVLDTLSRQLGAPALSHAAFPSSLSQSMGLRGIVAFRAWLRLTASTN